MPDAGKKRYAIARLLVAVFVANWLFAPFLFARHEHVWCAKHQRFEHLPHAAHDRVSHENPVVFHENRSQDEAAPSLRDLPDWLTHPHEACYVLAQLNQFSNASGDAPHRAPTQAPDFYALEGYDLFRVSIPQFLLAPKNSPPRA